VRHGGAESYRGKVAEGFGRKGADHKRSWVKQETVRFNQKSGILSLKKARNNGAFRIGGVKTDPFTKRQTKNEKNV